MKKLRAIFGAKQSRVDGDAAHQTLWGWLRVLRPVPPQEIVEPAQQEDRHKSISGWRHIRGRWFYSESKNALMRADRRFIAAFRKLRALSVFD